MNIPRGADRAISIGALAEQTGLSRRTVERYLEARVKAGLPIIASERGIFLAETAAETRSYILSLKGRIGAISDRIRALEKWADEQEQPEALTLWEAAA